MPNAFEDYVRELYYYFAERLTCSRRSDSGVRAKKKASERARKKRGKTREEDEGTPVKLILKSPCRPL